MSSGVVYFVSVTDRLWICIPRQELRRVRVDEFTESGTCIYALMLTGQEIVINLSWHRGGGVSTGDNTPAIEAVFESLTSSVDTDVTWTKVHPTRWDRTETRPV